MCLYPWLGSILHHYYPYPTRPVDIPSLITHGHHHVIHVLRLWLIISSYRCCPTYKPPLVEHMREHSLFRATTQRMLILPSIMSHKSRNTPASDPSDIAQSLVDHAHPKQAKHNVRFIKNRLALNRSHQTPRLPDHLAGDTCCQAPSVSNAIIYTSIAWRDNPYCQVLHASILYWFCSYRLAVKHHRQALH